MFVFIQNTVAVAAALAALGLSLMILSAGILSIIAVINGIKNEIKKRETQETVNDTVIINDKPRKKMKKSRGRNANANTRKHTVYKRRMLRIG